ncbi:phosphatidylinositol-3-phosphatase myotubularin-1-like isoform X2 [Prosopis cineraria]|uniref:phosphatidylinositol-3-phosphatase myotubularin-1-like isoform X2 n=1 Tax=Prosopis cineraria TaxID=364024 RepID=UPI0024106415|nr:phosphatidylinositol-3-phosphatase myotubularin-1-like isoform X2 [Prosopis cineraria]
MASPTPGSSRSASFRDDDSDTAKLEGTGSWDAIEWTKIEEYGVVLVNNNDVGTLMVTNFRLLFVSEKTTKVIALGTIPLATIEKFTKIAVKTQSTLRQLDKTPSQRLLQVIGKDMRIIVFGFRSRTKQRRAIFETLLRLTKPARLWDLYPFVSRPSSLRNTNPKVRLLDEYFRLLGKGSYRGSIDMIRNGSFTLSNALWRISSVNSNYTMCQTYPFALIIPKSISDDEVVQASTFRARCRLPVVSWCDPGTGAVLARSSQPLVGLMMNMRSNTDEKLVAALCNKLDDGSRRKLYIADARPRKNALANVAMGGGSESSSNYFQCEVVYFGIDNIHAMRDSFARLREYLDTYGKASSDGMSSFSRNGGWTWGGGLLSGMSASVSTLGDSGWLLHIQNVLAGSAWIAARVAVEKASVLAHCSDGWDRTTQLVSLASLLLDPYYRTFKGFQALVEKDWLAFGHPFSDRVGMPSVSGSGNTPELSWQSPGNHPSSPMRQSSGALSSQPPTSHAQTSNNYSPIFLQWVDCVSQLLRTYPFAFEFSSAFLVDFLDCVLSCRFGNFLCNSEKERQQLNVFEACGCLWAYLAELRASESGSHVHYNLFYDPSKHDGHLRPPAAALAPTLWPQFHLRWVCPEESQAGEIESECRKMALNFCEMRKAKEEAEKKADEIANAMESLKVERRNEKQLRISAMNIAKRTNKENVVMKRAIQSIGRKVYFSSSDDSIVDIEICPAEAAQNLKYSLNGKEFDDKKDLSASVTITEHDNDANIAISQVCETLCPFRSQDGHCRWPNSVCAQRGSQFVGLKANFDALDQLLINDDYFKPE